jgi:Uma2 family endonuclease
VEAVGLATFPDAAVIGDRLAQHAPSPAATATNPTVLVEVTSDSSEAYDTGFKCEAYQSIPSLRAYVVVSHRGRRLTVHAREPDGTWRRESAGPGERLAVEAVGAVLDVDAIYRQSAVT